MSESARESMGFPSVLATGADSHRTRSHCSRYFHSRFSALSCLLISLDLLATASGPPGRGELLVPKLSVFGHGSFGPMRSVGSENMPSTACKETHNPAHLKGG